MLSSSIKTIREGNALSVEAGDLYCDSDGSDDDTDCELVPEPVAVAAKQKKKEPVRKGPTTRAHCSQQSTTPADYVPSDDEGPDVDLDPLDDDGFESMSWVMPKGRKSRAKKREPRVWYDESRLQPEQGLCLKMCFLDVYQFRRAVQTLHIAQLRNFRYHRNYKDRVIVKCSEKDCPFFMVGSKIGREKSFCLRKMNLDHTCGTSGEHCKITCEWVAKMCEPAVRIDLRTDVETIEALLLIDVSVQTMLALIYIYELLCSMCLYFRYFWWFSISLCPNTGGNLTKSW